MRRTRRLTFSVGIWLGVVLSAPSVRGDEILLRVRDVSKGGLAVGRVDLTAAARHTGRVPVSPEGLTATTASGQPVPLQFVREYEFDDESNAAGVILLRLPPGSRDEQWLELHVQTATEAPTTKPWDGVIRREGYTITHDAKRMAGLPSRIEFPATGTVFDSFRWNDRLHHRERGGFLLRDDAEATMALVADGSLATVVRGGARYLRPDGEAPDSYPYAIYDWYYFRDSPVVLVTATIRQNQRFPLVWDEVHFLELNFPDESFVDWASGEPTKQGRFTGGGKSFHSEGWGALVAGDRAIAVLDAGRVIFHDGRGAYGTYLHARGAAAWEGWGDEKRITSAWLWLGSSPNVIDTLRAAADDVPRVARMAVSSTLR